MASQQSTSKKVESDAGHDLFTGLQAERVQTLNDLDDGANDDGRYVLYWMQQSQRSELNDALEYAIHRANELELPLLVAFGLMDDYPEASLRHDHFMLQGLADVEAALAKRSITFVLRGGRRTRSPAAGEGRGPAASATVATCATSGSGVTPWPPRLRVRSSRSRAMWSCPWKSRSTRRSRRPGRSGRRSPSISTASSSTCRRPR